MNKILITKDLSPTVYSEKFDQTYHSHHGACQESLHVYINHGLRSFANQSSIRVFELGYGTGLNAALTYLFAENNQILIDYLTIEKFPLSNELILELNIPDSELNEKMMTLNQLSWGQQHQLPNFNFMKREADILNFQFANKFDVIYYDAFSPNAQPELWTTSVFEKVYDAMNRGGVLTTYCAKGDVKRNLRTAGFEIQSVDGPIGKREITTAWKK